MTPMKGLFHLVHVFVYFTCMSVSAMCVCAPHAMCTTRYVRMCTTHMPGAPQACRRGLWIPRERSYSRLPAVTWVLGLKPESSARAESALTSLALHLFIFEKESRVSQTGRTCCVARISLKLLRILLPQAPNPRIADLPPPWPTHSTVDICNCQKSLQTSECFKQQLSASFTLPLPTLDLTRAWNLGTCCRTYNNTMCQKPPFLPSDQRELCMQAQLRTPVSLGHLPRAKVPLPLHTFF